MAVSDKFHAPASSPLGRTPTSTEQEADSALDQVWKSWKREKYHGATSPHPSEYTGYDTRLDNASVSYQKRLKCGRHPHTVYIAPKQRCINILQHHSGRKPSLATWQ
jgi:hypothetical protein